MVKPSTGGLAHKVQIIAILVSIAIIILLALFIIIRHYQKEMEIENILKLTKLKHIPYGDIKRATRNFDENQLLGEGGFGKVYKVPHIFYSF